MTLSRTRSLTETRAVPPTEMILGRSRAMEEVRRKMALVARTDIPVLLQGESGTGKDLCAKLIHNNSERSRSPYVKVNCPAIPATQIESELFGYERGAFPGAMTSKQGMVEQAHHGTLILDEIGSLDSVAQSKLVHVLQDGTFTRIGGTDPRSVSARIISIANQDLRRHVDEGSFRIDLFYRINAVTIQLPPLRERRDDFPELIQFFARQHAHEFRVPPRSFSKGLLRLINSYDWPGNIRQLSNVVRSFALLGDEDALAAELTSSAPTSDQITAKIDITKPLSLKKITKRATQDLEREIIMKVLRANSWNRQKTAKWLQISYRSLLYKLSEAEAPRDTPQEAEVEVPREVQISPETPESSASATLAMSSGA